MKAQDHTEEVLKSIHVLFSKATPYAGSKYKVVIDKEKVMTLLRELNACIYDMMEEFELTSNSRERAEREAQKHGDELMLEAKKNAEDIYAASIMYSDKALDEIQDIMKDAEDKIDLIRDEAKERIRQKRQKVRENQYELKGQLNTLIDTQKYLMLIDEENARIKREKENKNKDKKSVKVEKKEKITPEIKINPNYFKQTGQDIENYTEAEEDLESAAREMESLDAEYFDWKGTDEKPKKNITLFSKRAGE